MKRFLPVIIFIIALGGAYYYGHLPVQNPDPNHSHADFAVWVNGQHLDFSDEKYMTEELTDAQLEALKTSTATGTSLQILKQYLHLHDGNGHVIHRHKPGLTVGDFFESLGFTLNLQVAVDDSNTMNGCVTLPDGQKLCNGNLSTGWQVLVNDAPIGCRREHGDIICGGPNEPPHNPKSDIEDAWNYAFQDGDKILLSYGPFFAPGEEGITPDTQEMKREWLQMTDDSCLYSKTCPWRGDAPTESCIADPTVPCTE